MKDRTLREGAGEMPLRVSMDDGEFGRFSAFIESELGIKMPPGKKVMLEARLHKRLRALRLPSFGAYYDHVFQAEGGESELIFLIDAVTTNKTDFFREPSHFDYLRAAVLPELLQKEGAGLRRPVTVWSAGCSTGEEPYTLAMVLSEFSAEVPGYRFTILATDISSRVLEAAHTGIYEEEKVEPVPMALRRRYLLRAKDRDQRLVRIVPSLRQNIRFRRLNLMDADFGMRGEIDVIFCRNVVIYFDRPTQERLVLRFTQCLRPGGFLFMGHSETLAGMQVPVVTVAPTVYRKAS